MMGPTPATAIVGVGYSDLSYESGVSVLQLARTATARAIEDAGLAASDIDGVGTFSVGDSVPAQAVATSLSCGELGWCADLYLGGQAPAYLVLLADAAIRAGLATSVVVFRAMNGRSGIRIGRMDPPDRPASVSDRLAAGLVAYPQLVAMWAQRFMVETGATEDDLASVVTSQRWYAERNPRAIVRSPITRDEYFASPMIASPFRVADCTREVDGACALVVTSLDRARHLTRAPVVVAGGAFAAGPRSGREFGDVLLWDDYSRNCMDFVGKKLWSRTGLSARDLDVAEIYDCFSSSVLMALEGLGIVPRGESGAFIGAGETQLGGQLPVNTHGGLLSEGYIHGMNTVAEAVLQIRGDAGERTVEGAEVALATSGTLMDGSAIVLTQDR